MTILNQSAYQESGKIITAYHLGYTCSNCSISDIDPFYGTSAIDIGSDKEYVDFLLQRSQSTTKDFDPNELRSKAIKLISVFVAGSCTRLYFMNEKVIPSEAEISLPGNDHRKIELVLDSLKKVDPFFDNSIVELCIRSVFNKLSLLEYSIPIEKLANYLIESHPRSIEKIEIEKFLLEAGTDHLLPASERRLSTNISLHDSSNETSSKTVGSEADLNEKYSKVKSILLGINNHLPEAILREHFNQIVEVFKG